MTTVKLMSKMELTTLLSTSTCSIYGMGAKGIDVSEVELHDRIRSGEDKGCEPSWDVRQEEAED